MNPAIPTIRKHLKKKLSPGRYEHTLGVSYTCMALAMRHGGSLEQAELAGLLHDCAKRYDDAAILEKCDRKGIALTEGERRAPAVVHAKLGAWMAEHKYGISDPAVLSAIACHTTGKPAMSLLDKILYVADYIEPRRNRAPDLERLRRLAFVDLDEALYQILEGTLGYLNRIGAPVDAMTKEAWQYYREQREEKGSCTDESAAAAAETAAAHIAVSGQKDTVRSSLCTDVQEDTTTAVFTGSDKPAISGKSGTETSETTETEKEGFAQYVRRKGIDQNRRKGASRQKRRGYPYH